MTEVPTGSVQLELERAASGLVSATALLGAGQASTYRAVPRTGGEL